MRVQVPKAASSKTLESAICRGPGARFGRLVMKWIIDRREALSCELRSTVLVLKWWCLFRRRSKKNSALPFRSYNAGLDKWARTPKQTTNPGSARALRPGLFHATASWPAWASVQRKFAQKLYQVKATDPKRSCPEDQLMSCELEWARWKLSRRPMAASDWQRLKGSSGIWQTRVDRIPQGSPQ